MFVRPEISRQPELGSPSGKLTGGRSVGGLRRLSTIAEQEPDKDPNSHDSWGGSSFSMCSDKFKSGSSRFSSEDSFQPDTGGINCP